MAKSWKQKEAGKKAAEKEAPEKRPGPPRKDALRELLKDWRILLLAVLLVFSLISIFPHVEDGKFAVANQFGLDLQGGSWLQMSFDSGVAGFTSQRDPYELAENLTRRLDAEVSVVGPGQLEIR
ncbi:MAG: hypothetical protein LUQ67_07130, partial [Methanomicrobiales archaeon]|nr:hypothetical protein [Methanomicrobiales archaeon]